MNNEKTREDKLREAADNLYYTISNKQTKLGLTNTLIEFAKSREAAEYHQSLQPVVDVDKLALDIFLLIPVRCPDNKECMNVAKRIVNTLLPHLQPAAPESDAVDFADWLKENKYKRGDDWYHGIDRMKTTSILYAEYKQPKTKSDATNNS